MTVKPHEVSLDANGMVKPTHGISVHLEAAKMERFGGANQIKSIPDELQIIQRGRDPLHYEIVPRRTMPPSEFQRLINQIEFY